MRNEDNIQSLRSGIDTLRLLNIRESVGIAEVCEALGLSRAAAYRVLHTLHALGYVTHIRSGRSGRYRLSIRARRLSDGFHGDRALLHVAEPLMLAFTRQYSWPLALSTPAGDRFFVRFTTDHVTTRVLRRYRAGFYRSVLLAGAGLVCLANERPVVQVAVLHELARRYDPSSHIARDESVPRPDNPAALQALLARISSQRYATYHERGERERSIAVPLHLSDQFVGALTLRFMQAANRSGATPASLLLLLRGLGADIEAGLAAHQDFGGSGFRVAL